MNKVYTFRLDPNSRQKLQQLADESYRSPAQLLRFLINLACNNPSIVHVSAKTGMSDSDFPSSKSCKNDIEEG
jgi:predicted transcriptional regulator